ncbi:uncharacterized protein [Lepeophtheirus salmonis]|uniref:uncharacterized protein isoform X1 n=1 Tax=Lepeophtheirus salmonis TaxID=72036 RepID=UPI001AE9C9E6|nr:uncharacterized protein LOC121123099 isoform X1 [Lepeophtheirus salmonis]XP_040574122.1 uncharacterized protein LOC121123099 isoform X1 [Lepeophtheirus salmonis]XP_040574124.1 uncharacterized protein LOC121123099 isoform X1 [Lepeophtheirus salmonis]XP_040574125.1 uncharacterized protein LOC121123099 isoform X1 [Lepeophtheirus salmonis]XP_040574126.1 uncharacterized protein LOC121123099 isoform X1 [Lepeophtheirus salmonis]XP_040574127.1 uncharacterized protein LOC121123099 isoform X1 [Lepeop
MRMIEDRPTPVEGDSFTTRRSRRKSWPPLEINAVLIDPLSSSMADSGVGHSRQGDELHESIPREEELVVVEPPQSSVVSAKTFRRKRIASIFQHYYPEGGWGYVIVITTLLVTILNHGTQLSFGYLGIRTAMRYRVDNFVLIVRYLLFTVISQTYGTSD